MWDYSIESIGLKMTLASLGEPVKAELPEKYDWRFYQPGDEVYWAKMWKSAGGFKSEEAALETFRQRGWATHTFDGRWRLTPEGFLLSNSIISDLLIIQEKTESIGKRR